ncbi:MAG TPA: carboxypeptidase regulatory-like domain-containing protein [Anaeromyxobacter sp.]
MAFVAACGSSSGSSTCDPAAQTGCGSGQVCEVVQNGSPACFAPVLVRGSAADSTTAVLLNDARVVALDSNRAPVSTVQVTANDGTANGAYVLKLARATRADATGRPAQASITLRADKQGYQTFPSGIRMALPIDLSGATPSSGSWVVSGPLTALKLAPVSSSLTATAFIHGSVAAAPSGAGTLIVAEPSPGGAGPQTGFTGVADDAGNYAIYNLNPGTQYVVTAYTKGANYAPVTTAALVAGDNAVSILTRGSGTGATLTGGLIFNNGASSSIEATLVVQSTYVPTLDRGETPPGLTVAVGASGYSFSGVPDGKYVVLAPFGLTGDVRDVSGGGNTAAPNVTIASGAVVGTPPSFKIIPAVDLLTIGGTSVGANPVTVTTATPTFAWQKQNVDSSAATYRVLVFDSFGNPTWSNDMAANTTDSIPYGGTALQAGMTYQLRILAIKEAMPVSASFTQLSQTEDVRGVFTFQP